MLVGIQEVIIICVPEGGTGTIKCEIQERREKKKVGQRERKEKTASLNKQSYRSGPKGFIYACVIHALY